MFKRRKPASVRRSDREYRELIGDKCTYKGILAMGTVVLALSYGAYYRTFIQPQKEVEKAIQSTRWVPFRMGDCTKYPIIEPCGIESSINYDGEKRLLINLIEQHNNLENGYVPKNKTIEMPESLVSKRYSNRIQHVKNVSNNDSKF